MRLPILALIVIPLAAQDAGDWRAWLNKGIQAYKSARYDEATEAFQKAVALNPDDVTPHLYLGTAYMTQYIPGAQSPENQDLARRAEAEFNSVLQLDPNDKTALASLASLAYQQAQISGDPAEKLRHLDEADGWYQKLALVDSQNKEAYYSRGVIVWAKWYPSSMRARAEAGMKPEDPGPLPNPAVRHQLSAQFSALIERGMEYLQKALEIDPNYDDAMAYLNLLIRERADLRDTREQYRRDVELADQWVQKALDAKRAKAPAEASSQTNRESADQSPRIRVDAQAQERKLIRRVDPVYPPLAREARIQGTVRFTVIIGADGLIRNVQLISGHPLLVESARAAVSQWVYRPTLLNGAPAEVIAPVEVTFALGKQ